MKAPRMKGSVQAYLGENRKMTTADAQRNGPEQNVQFKLYGEEVVHKTVAASGRCGRIYLPLGWVGKKVKIIRVD
jgi:hypothetical protein